MKIDSLYIENFKSIQSVNIQEIDNAFILVGKNNTGKSSVIDAIRAVFGEYTIRKEHFMDSMKSVIIKITLSQPLVKSEGKTETEHVMLRSVTYKVTPDGKKFYIDEDGISEEMPEYLPRLYYIDHRRNLKEFQEALLNLQGDESVAFLKEKKCYYEERSCDQCFRCIAEIEKKSGEEMNVFEMARLMEYRLYKMNLDRFSDSVNKYLKKNGMMSHKVKYEIDFDTDSLLNFDTIVYQEDRGIRGNLSTLGAGSKSIYLLSLLEAYTEENSKDPGIIMIEDPEMFLHPQLQKTASEILYRFSKKNQMIFSTYSPNMIFNFSSKQIKQVVIDEELHTCVQENVDIDIILDDLGYSANDLMNVSFVFIVEGKQDRNRLPLLLEKYYSEIRDDEGNLKRITIVTTNSCTNIKTYANLKYINKLYLKDQFLMIRDSDGKNPKHLTKQLCSYYRERSKEEGTDLPNVTPKNILILKYYSFENYFLDPSTMVKIGVLKSEEQFYDILYKKYKEYLYRLPSMKRLIRTKNVRINNKEDVKKNIEWIKIYVRGHNLYDIFYGKYRSEEEKILKKYVEEAPKEVFADILEAIDSFVYFENRKK
ncbi:MAG: AAA family ATPase [Lachnospiraceae bacterium]|nr:AAA family ATPase [Lachnospiraceae bacterium]MCI8826341.1 AAA family ATPase [Lachnospiraceae bacterium]MCI9368876.1 AAA family ATPase [Lachnospiraceae bacterium]